MRIGLYKTSLNEFNDYADNTGKNQSPFHSQQQSNQSESKTLKNGDVTFSQSQKKPAGWRQRRHTNSAIMISSLNLPPQQIK